MKNGFTLVELSIVLVIIGLLIGGILVGQSLIQSAKINRIISQYQQHLIAFEHFKDKFRCLPGDCNKGFSQNGSNNGSIAQDYTDAHLTREPEIIWLQLHQAGFLKTPYIGNNGLNGAERIKAGTNVPHVKEADEVTKEAMLGFFGHYGLGHILNPGWVTFEIGTKYDGYGSVRMPVFSASTATSIDKKTDDGAPVTGFVYVDGAFGGCVTGSAYDLNLSTPCALLFAHQIGSADHL